MASLRTRPRADGTTAYHVLMRLPDEHGRTRQTSETFDTEADAARFLALCRKHGDSLARLILDAQDGSHAEAITLAALLDRYNASRVGVAIGTTQRYAHFAAMLTASHLGDLPVDAITRDHITRWVAELARAGLSEKTIKDRKQYLSGAFTWGMDAEPPLATRNPARRIAVPRTERREMVTLEPWEVARLLAVVDDHWRPLITTLIGTGLRIGEATALQVRDLHLSDRPATLTVARGWQYAGSAEARTGAPKTARGRRTISLPAEVVAALATASGGRRGEAWVFLDEQGRPITHERERLRRKWLHWVASAEIDKRPRLHDLRHTHASILIANGVPLTVVQHRLGHASIKVTSDTYTHVMPESQVAAQRAASLAFTAPEALAIES